MGEMDFKVIFCNNNTFLYQKAAKHKLLTKYTS